MIQILAAAIIIVASLTLPKAAVAFMLGVILPIDVFSSVSPASFDAARYGLAVALIVRSLGDGTRQSGKLAKLTLIVLLALSTVALLRSVFDLRAPETSSTFVAILSIGVAYSLAKIRTLHAPIALGFVLGATASAADIISQVAGFPYLGTPAAPPFNRYGGFSFSSTNAAPYLAIAIIVVLAGTAGKKTIRPATVNRTVTKAPLLLLALQCVAALLLAVGLLLSGGRGGLVGLALAIALMGLNRRHQYPVSILAIIAVTFTALVVKLDDIASFLDRGGANSGGFTTGRLALNSDTWQAILDAGLWGPDSVVANGLRPHTPILTFGVSAGVFGVLLAAGLVLMVARVAVTAFSTNSSATVYNLVAAIILASSLLEPVGFFVGLTKTTILMIVLVGAKSSEPASDPLSATTESIDDADQRMR